MHNQTLSCRDAQPLPRSQVVAGRITLAARGPFPFPPVPVIVQP